MPNPILTKKRDKSITKAIKDSFRDGTFSAEDLKRLLDAAWDGDEVSDVEYRDLKRLMRTERRLLDFHKLLIETWLVVAYPLEGPFLFPGDVSDLEGEEPLGNRECAALVQHSQPIGKAVTWREGIKVQGNAGLIKKGTAVATFEDGLYPNRGHRHGGDNHVAYYLSQNSDGIEVMDQFSGKPTISSRTMPFKGKRSDGLYIDPSNNGEALSVIMRKPK